MMKLYAVNGKETICREFKRWGGVAGQFAESEGNLAPAAINKKATARVAVFADWWRVR